MSDEWTSEDWAAWRANNRRLLDEGWELRTSTYNDGTVKCWADKDGKRIDRTPKFKRDEEGNYIYGPAI